MAQGGSVLYYCGDGKYNIKFPIAQIYGRTSWYVVYMVLQNSLPHIHNTDSLR